MRILSRSTLLVAGIAALSILALGRDGSRTASARAKYMPNILSVCSPRGRTASRRATRAPPALLPRTLVPLPTEVVIGTPQPGSGPRGAQAGATSGLPGADCRPHLADLHLSTPPPCARAAGPCCQCARCCAEPGAPGVGRRACVDPKDGTVVSTSCRAADDHGTADRASPRARPGQRLSWG